MIPPSLLPLALLALFGSRLLVKAATIEGLCQDSYHCAYGPPPNVRIGDIVVQAGAGKVLQTGQNSNGEGIWLLSAGAAGHIDVHCKKSASVESWYFYLDQKGGISKLRGGDLNTGTASVGFVGMGAVRGGNEEQSKDGNIDVYITCP